MRVMRGDVIYPGVTAGTLLVIEEEEDHQEKWQHRAKLGKKNNASRKWSPVL